MSDENKDIVLQDSESGVELTSDQVSSLFTSEEEVAPKFESAPEPAVENSEETALLKQRLRRLSNQVKRSVSTEEVEDMVFTYNDREYNGKLTLAIDALQNRDEWQKSNTQKAQQIAEERKQLDVLMSKLTML